METISKKAYAKINLTLDVISKLDNGYHELKMIMQQISMHDTIKVSKLEEDIIVLNCNKKISELKDNIVYKACQLIKDEYNIKEGIKVDLEKNIFISAGLAGGSTDCATTLVCINELFKLNLTLEEIKELGGRLGKDVPFCVQGGLVIATGDGTKLEKIDSYDRTYLLVANPNIEVSTKYVFENFDFSNRRFTDYNTIIEAIKNNDLKAIGGSLNNMLESVTIEKYPIIKDIKDCMTETGAIGALMSGSGATVFGIYNSKEDAFFAKEKLNSKFSNILAEVCFTL